MLGTLRKVALNLREVVPLRYLTLAVHLLECADLLFECEEL